MNSPLASLENHSRIAAFSKRSLLALGVILLVTFCAPLLGAFSPPADWFESLRKPSWNPPGWLFGPVWSLLYIGMAVAAWLVWREGGWAAQKKPLSLYAVQLTLNALWTPLFFRFHRPDLALINIMLLWCLIVATGIAFYRVRKGAGGLFVPYGLWVSFATVLNFTLWWMNRG